MSLSSLHLEAFVMVARSKSFSEAAKKLHITQSALSQRILNLEDELEVTLFIRDPKELKVTELGENLLKYCKAKDSLEGEFFQYLKLKDKEKLSGVIKIGTFSTHGRSSLLPKLGKFQRLHPHVNFELMIREVRDLPFLLKSGQVDFIFSTLALEKQEVENHLLSYEENILIESKNYAPKANVYIDHDELDTTTVDFWKIQRAPPKTYRRAYFDEIYTIIDAVIEGFGRAVVPRHLVEGNKFVQEVKGLKPLRVPIYLIYFKQAYYTKLQTALLDYLKKSL